MSFDPNPTINQGGDKKVNVVDLSTNELLTLILYELKKLNFHQSIITDNEFITNEIE